jgi:hypothetical protein
MEPNQTPEERELAKTLDELRRCAVLLDKLTGTLAPAQTADGCLAAGEGKGVAA